MRFLLIFSILFLLNNSLWSQSLPKIEFQTSVGKIVVEIDTVHAPVTAKNFLAHIKTALLKMLLFIALSDRIISQTMKLKLRSFRADYLRMQKLKNTRGYGTKPQKKPGYST